MRIEVLRISFLAQQASGCGLRVLLIGGVVLRWVLGFRLVVAGLVQGWGIGLGGEESGIGSFPVRSYRCVCRVRGGRV